MWINSLWASCWNSLLKLAKPGHITVASASGGGDGRAGPKKDLQQLHKKKYFMRATGRYFLLSSRFGRIEALWSKGRSIPSSCSREPKLQQLSSLLAAQKRLNMIATLSWEYCCHAGISHHLCKSQKMFLLGCESTHTSFFCSKQHLKEKKKCTKLPKTSPPPHLPSPRMLSLHFPLKAEAAARSTRLISRILPDNMLTHVFEIRFGKCLVYEKMH